MRRALVRVGGVQSADVVDPPADGDACPLKSGGWDGALERPQVATLLLKLIALAESSNLISRSMRGIPSTIFRFHLECRRGDQLQFGLLDPATHQRIHRLDE